MTANLWTTGTIDFVPATNARPFGPREKSGAGRYDMSERIGLLPDGVYTVRITAFRKTGKLAFKEGPARHPRCLR